MERSQTVSKSGAPLVGNARYEGLLVDLVEEVAAAIGFNFVFEPVDSIETMVQKLIHGVSNTAVIFLGHGSG